MINAWWRTSRVALFLALVLGAATAAAALNRQAVPVDEARSDAVFLSFRDALLDAVERRDVDFVVSQAADDIRLDFGGLEGRDAFEQKLTLAPEDLAPQYADLADALRDDYWNALEKVLRMGGRFDEEARFVAPYTFGVDIGPDADAFSTWFVIDAGVPLLEHASSRSEVITTLAYDIVTASAPDPDAEYLEVHTDDGKTGYVASSHLWSAVGYRATFEQIDGEWRMTAFVAGD